MKHKVAELEGALLDAAVALALGWTVDAHSITDPARPNDPIHLGPPGEWCPPGDEHFYFAPSQRWEDAGPIIERDRIVPLPIRQPISGAELWAAVVAHGYAVEGGEEIDGVRASLSVVVEGVRQRGSTCLIAAMRAFVASKFGETVELP